MIDIDRWREIYLVLSHHKLRTCLTAFGVFWGIFMLVMLLGMGRGLERGVLETFGGHTNTIFIWSSGRTQLPYKGLGKGRRMRLDDGDRQALLRLNNTRLLNSVNDLGGWQTAQYIVRQNKSGTFGTRGMEPSGFELAQYAIPEGRSINSNDYAERRKVAVIGSSVREILFDDDESPIGENLKIAGVNFVVIGVFESIGNSGGANQDNERIFIPNSSLRNTFNQTHYIGHFQLAPNAGVSAIDLEQQAKAVLYKRHRIHPDDSGVIGVWNAQKEYDKIQGLFQAIRIFSWVVAIGTVIAGVVGVGNIMLIVVKERTREIGVRKALGATSNNIIYTIVQEALVLTFISGYFGLACGVFALEGVNYIFANMQSNAMFGKADIDFSVAIMALATLIAAGLLASVMPASKAAKVDPIVALQDE